MGIKGIYKELGPGKRISLSKLASDSFKDHDRPLRLAIDIAIWQFQNQAARGGTNPAIRTLFYRLVRLLGTPIQPIFVFDGPNKPKFKRNRRSGRGDSFSAAHAKRLIRLFGFIAHDAPGEAEAECALLQKNGIVDAVLSEDVDTIMFGCTRTMRNWSAEGKGTKPTHVSMYDVDELNLASMGLDREGMVLVALMSGGDYIPEGVPGCGPKVACEAAKAGFGKSLCQLRASDTEGLRQWRASLIHELKTNESKYFRVRHKSLVIPEDFPNMEVLRYYTHPVVSPVSRLNIVRHKLRETKEVQLEGLREYARETFSWDYRIGAIKFIRVLSEALFVNRLHQDGVDGDSLVQKVSTSRSNFSTDNTCELRLAYIPEEIVPIDISNEVEEEKVAYARSGLALNSDDEFAASGGAEVAEGGGRKAFDMTKPELAWVLEEVARRFAPKSVEAWEEGKSKRKSPSKKKATGSKAKKADIMPHGALDSYIRVTKVVESQEKASSDVKEGVNAMNEISEPESADVSLPPLRQPTRIRQPQTPPSLRQSSKQPTPNATSPNLDTWTITSSLDPTRRHDGAGVFEAIVISSSPAGDASPLSRFTPPSAVATTSTKRSQELPRSIRSILAAGATSRVTTQHTSSLSKPSMSKRKLKTSSAATNLKQTSIDMFTQRQPAPGMDRTEHGSYKSNRSRGDIGTISEIEIPSSTFDSTNTNRVSTPPPTASHRDKNPNSIPIKKLIVPSTSRPGFFDEVEVDADVYEETVARARGVRSGVTRWSDASLIDLMDERD
ncbi:hypothetical protein ACQKWADRAFT_289951 [Trichoderma austrokoningii]